jgi:tetratricopeptide (TPR) repeat protein
MIRIFSFLLFLSILSSACTNDPEPGKQVTGPQVDPGLAALSQQIEASPEKDSLLFERASLYYMMEGYDEALRDLNRAMQIDSMQPAYYHLLADVLLDYARPNDSRRAIDVLKLATERFPDRILTMLKLSEFQLIVRQHNEALATLNKVLERDPQSSEGFFMTGRVALDMGDTSRAISAFQRSGQLDSDNIDVWMFLGRIFSNKNSPLAIQYFDNALRLDSTLLEAREFKGVYYKRRGEFDEAFEIYKDIIVRNPDYSNAYFDMGMIYLELDSLRDAQKNFDLAIKTDPLFVRAYYYRGVSYETEGKVEDAINDYKQAAKMAPSFEEPKAALERLKAQ